MVTPIVAIKEKLLATRKTLNRFWRMLATGFCFVLFGLGAFLLSLVWFRLLFLLVRDPIERQNKARSNISSCFRFFLETARVIGALDYEVKGAEILQKDKGCLVLANHPTLIDYVLITSILPKADCIVKAGLQHMLLLFFQKELVPRPIKHLSYKEALLILLYVYLVT